MKKVVLYMRVSTENQKEKGSIESQRIRLRDYCKFREWEIVKEYQDNGVSGSKFGKDRPGWNDLIEEVRDPRRKWDGIVSFKLDRIGRSLPHLVQIINELKKNKVDLTLTDDIKIDTTSPEGELVFHIFASLSEYERKRGIQRTKAGLERRRREGKSLGRRSLTDSRSKAFIPPEKIRKIRELREGGMSFRKISTEVEIPKSTVEKILKTVHKSTTQKSRGYLEKPVEVE